MAKGKPMEFWLVFETGNGQDDMIFTKPPKSGVFDFHVREVIELTDKEKRRVGMIRTMNADGNGVDEHDVGFLLSLLERAGVV